MSPWARYRRRPCNYFSILFRTDGQMTTKQINDATTSSQYYATHPILIPHQATSIITLSPHHHIRTYQRLIHTAFATHSTAHPTHAQTHIQLRFPLTPIHDTSNTRITIGDSQFIKPSPQHVSPIFTYRQQTTQPLPRRHNTTTRLAHP